MALSSVQRAAYAAPALALAVVGVPVYVHLPKFYADVVGVDLALLGSILIAVRLSDALSDPLVGLLSDRTRGRFGRPGPAPRARLPVLMDAEAGDSSW